MSQRPTDIGRKY